MQSIVNYRDVPTNSFTPLSSMVEKARHLTQKYVFISSRTCVLLLHSYYRQLTKYVLFTRGGKEGRYVNLSRINPNALTKQKIGNAEYVALTSLTSSQHNVVCNLQLGSLVYSNLEEGGTPPDSKHEKKCIRIELPTYFGIRMQSVVCLVTGLKLSPRGQCMSGYLEFSTRMAEPGSSFVFSFRASHLIAVFEGPVQTTLPGSSGRRTTTMANVGVRVATKQEIFRQGKFILKLGVEDEGVCGSYLSSSEAHFHVQCPSTTVVEWTCSTIFHQQIFPCTQMVSLIVQLSLLAIPSTRTPGRIRGLHRRSGVSA